MCGSIFLFQPPPPPPHTHTQHTHGLSGGQREKSAKSRGPGKKMHVKSHGSARKCLWNPVVGEQIFLWSAKKCRQNPVVGQKIDNEFPWVGIEIACELPWVGQGISSEIPILGMSNQKIEPHIVEFSQIFNAWLAKVRIYTSNWETTT